jgi:glutamine kinase
VTGQSQADQRAWPKLHALELVRAVNARSFNTLPFVAIGTDEWRSSSDDLIRGILDANLGPIVVVRSCAAMEDANALEPPGFFESVLDVIANAHDLRWAIEKVIGSYSRRSSPHEDTHKVIIQQQLLAPTLCGVFRVGATEHDYLEIECDGTLGRTDSVTAGIRAKKVVLSSCTDLLIAPWLNIRRCADDLRNHFKAPFFVEFAVNESGLPTVFQIRPDRRPKIPSEAGLPPSCAHLADLSEAIEASGPLSVMADWNPAEMLGLHPMPLDVSLYDKLVMRGAWLEGRKSVGWHAPDDSNLMTTVAGRPYVKVALSLQSLLPQGLPSRLVDRLVRDRLALLSEQRQLHDKVEFRVVWSALAFDQAAVESDLRGRGFSPDEVQQLFGALRTVTRNAIAEAPKLLKSDRRGIAHLQAERRRLVKTTVLDKPIDAAQSIRSAVAVCRKYGTVPFSRQARLAFTFRYIINYLTETGAVRPQTVRRWQSRLNTVTRRFSRDLARVKDGKQSQEAFLARYGHLRPSTYNLESLRYDERPLLGGEQPDTSAGRQIVPGPSPRLAEILADLGSTCTQRQFWAAAAGAYKGREELKFAFTALLSDVLRMLATIANAAGLERREVRRVPISDFLSMLQEAKTWDEFGTLVLARPSNSAPLWPSVKLPDVIFGPSDLHVVLEPDARPTFVGNTSVTGPPRLVNGDSFAEPGSLSGNIIAIETPDPGYDWVFAHRIGGLITAYGGEFSHMGLRCAEFGIPAVLGCGQSLFAGAVEATQLKLDPAAEEFWADNKRLLPHE